MNVSADGEVMPTLPAVPSPAMCCGASASPLPCIAAGSSPSSAAAQYADKTVSNAVFVPFQGRATTVPYNIACLPIAEKKAYCKKKFEELVFNTSSKGASASTKLLDDLGSTVDTHVGPFLLKSLRMEANELKKTDSAVVASEVSVEGAREGQGSVVSSSQVRLSPTAWM